MRAIGRRRLMRRLDMMDQIGPGLVRFVIIGDVPDPATKRLGAEAAELDTPLEALGLEGITAETLIINIKTPVY